MSDENKPSSDDMTTKAVETLVELTDSKVAPEIRLQAAISLLSYASVID